MKENARSEGIDHHTTEMQSVSQTGQYVLQHFEEALQQHQIQVYYQPVVRTLTGALCGMEALARWIDPAVGMLSPAEFIPVLEESRRITQLDLYVLEEICAKMKAAERRGQKLLPVSFNLSRVDFLDTEIFTEVERITTKYGVPRDLINIEITESMVIEDSGWFREKIEQFRAGGYQVWMDDFGSGYSSLNVLKDFRFDEIKLDMKFLTTLDDISKKIIRSVVGMAKDLGIQTLAEGVETKEQFEFLRTIGCEKVQGYYFSRPVPLPEVFSQMQAAPVAAEDRGWRTYYDQVGQINFITDRALAICELDGNDYRVYFANEQFLDVWNTLGAGPLLEVYENIPERPDDFWKKYRKHLLTLQSDFGFHEMDYVYHGCAIRARTRRIASYRGRMLCHLEIADFTRLDNDTDREAIYSVLEGINERILLFDFEHNTVRQIARSAYSPSDLGEDLESRTPAECIAYAAVHSIYPDDRKEFLKFCDFSTLKARLKASARGFVANYLRTKTMQGAYVWQVHYLVNLPGSEKYIYLSKFAPLRQAGVIERVQDHQVIDRETGTFNLLWESLMNSQNINFFWKDKHRRFLGANQCFLNTYGFSSVADILGKTDEEMHWHTDEQPFKTDEERILQEGISIHNRVGSCIINGITYDILVNKEPFYQNGEIAGLWGSFTILENVLEEQNGVTRLHLVDPVTGVMTARGVMPVVLDYIEGWTSRREDFAVITIRMPRYQKVMASYGQAVAHQAMAHVGAILRRRVDLRGSCASIYGGTFVVYMHYTEKSEVTALTRELSREITAIHTVDHFPVTLRPNVLISYASDSVDMQDLLWRSMLPSIFRNEDDAAADDSDENGGKQTELRQERIAQEEWDATLTKRYGKYLKKRFRDGDLGQILSVTEFQSRMLNAISKAFISMHVINLEDQSYMKIFCEAYVDRVVKPFSHAQDALHAVMEELIQPESKDEAELFFDLSTVAERMRGKQVLHFDYSMAVNGWCRGLLIPVTYDPAGDVKEVLLLVQHIQADKDREENLRRLSETDGLSQLYNHVAGERHVNEYLEKGIYGMFCLMDIDQFKSINDTYGHAVGDEVIRGISRCMKETFRDGDVLMRVGGDEFAVYTPGLLDQEICNLRIALLKERISDLTFGDLTLSVSASIGTVICHENQLFDRFDELYKAADVLMYEQKQTNGRRSNITLPMELSDEMPTALLIYRADESEKILFASRGLIELFDCRTLEEFLDYTKSSFYDLVHPDDIERVEREIVEQIKASGEKCVDHVFYRIRSKKGRIKYIEDYGHLVDSKYYGHSYFVTLNEKTRDEVPL